MSSLYIKDESKPMLKWIHPSPQRQQTGTYLSKEMGNVVLIYCYQLMLAPYKALCRFRGRSVQALNTLEIKQNACGRQYDVPQMSLTHCYGKHLEVWWKTLSSSWLIKTLSNHHPRVAPTFTNETLQPWQRENKEGTIHHRRLYSCRNSIAVWAVACKSDEVTSTVHFTNMFFWDS